MQLLAVSGPFHYWGPVVDGQYLREAPARALQRAPRVKVDLLIGSSQDDGLINRAKAVKVGRRGLGVWPSDSGPKQDLGQESWTCLLVIFKTVAGKLHVQKLCKEFKRW